MRHTVYLAAALILGGISTQSISPAHGEIWLAAEDPETAARFAPGSSVDYLDLFKEGSQWQTVAKATNVLKIYNQFVLAPPDTQRMVYSWLNANNIALALEDGILPTANPQSCGWGVGGYSGSTIHNIRTMQSYGAKIAYLVMDEPLFHGVQSKGRNTCQHSIEKIAQQAGEKAAQIKRLFPGIKIGDVEPIPYTENIGQFLDAFTAAAGFSLDFFQADVVREPGWQDGLRDLKQELAVRNIPYGVMYNGTWIDCARGGDLAWTNAAINLYREVENDPTMRPESAIFQTWNKCPSHLLPETTPGTLTNVVRQYLDDFPTGGGILLSGSTPVSEPEMAATFGAILALLGLLHVGQKRASSGRIAVGRGVALPRGPQHRDVSCRVGLVPDAAIGGMCPWETMADSSDGGTEGASVNKQGKSNLKPAAAGWPWEAHSQTNSRLSLRRVFDVSGSLVLLALTLPVILLAMLLIRLDSAGPIFYRQERLGFRGRSFVLFKLRSMVVDSEARGPMWAAAHDPRVTRVGSVLRRTRIDELPQLYNVLRGEMSIIGPRPERPYFTEQLTTMLPHFRDRLQVKPGITGWAQVNLPYAASAEEAWRKLSYDLYYVRHRSIILDVRIILRTIRVVVLQEGAR